MKKLSIALFCLCIAWISTGVSEASYGSYRSKKSCDSGCSTRYFEDAKFILKNADDIGLSAGQEEAIMDHKYDMKRSKIQTKAEIKMLAVDISRELKRDVIDLATVNALIDRKYDLKAQKKKDAVAAKVALKNLLSEEQLEKMEDMREEMCASKYEKKCMKNEKHMMKKKR